MAEIEGKPKLTEAFRRAADMEDACGGISVGGRAGELGLMGDGQSEELRRLRSSHLNLLAACVTIMRGTDLITRWPCPDCGRAGPHDSKKLLRITREDGQEIRTGCWLCNTDTHRDQMRAAIERAREVAHQEPA